LILIQQRKQFVLCFSDVAQSPLWSMNSWCQHDFFSLFRQLSRIVLNFRSVTIHFRELTIKQILSHRRKVANRFFDFSERGWDGFDDVFHSNAVNNAGMIWIRMSDSADGNAVNRRKWMNIVWLFREIPVSKLVGIRRSKSDWSWHRWLSIHLGCAIWTIHGSAHFAKPELIEQLEDVVVRMDSFWLFRCCHRLDIWMSFAKFELRNIE
jgi:hypothetical protein